jgi:predicted nucleic acid-binding protein
VSTAGNTGVANKESAYVLDSFAALAYLEGELSADRVRVILQEAHAGRCQVFMSLINLGEVLYITEREQGLTKAQAALAAVEQLHIKILPATQQAVFASAHIKAQHRVSYADAFAIAAAQTLGAAVVTGDPEFKQVKDIVRIEWLVKKTRFVKSR